MTSSSVSRPVVIAGNWKMHKTRAEGQAFLEALAPQVQGSKQVWLAVPFTSLASLSDAAEGTSLKIGAQNMHPEAKGAFTGEISCEMLQDAGADFVLLGHSERRHLFGETDGFINQKVHRALAQSLQVVLCLGETLEQRRAEQTQAVLDRQLEESLSGVTAAQMHQVLLAYEPVWAIGTGETATPEMAQAAHQHIRQKVRALWGDEVADKIVIQYGGSVKPQNAQELLDQPDIDGVLVGGASLEPDVFAQIVNYNQ